MKRILLATTILAVSPAFAEDIITIGFTTSNSGKMQTDSTNQVNGYKLWQQYVNTTGGIQINGKKYKVNFVTRDDQSNPNQLQQIYTKLILQDNADFLFSPYSSGLTSTASIISEQYGKIMVAAGASDDQIFSHDNKLLYQIYAPASKYLTGALDIIKEQHPESRVALIYEDDNFAKAVAEYTRNYAKEIGVNLVYIDEFESNTTDFSPYISRMQSNNVTVLLGGGHYNHGVALAKASSRFIKFSSLLVAPDNTNFANLGDAAINVSGPVQWSSQVKFTTTYGPIPLEFVNAYKTAYNAEPGYHAAAGYAAGLILQHAIERANTLDTAIVAQKLNEMNDDTFIGHISFSKETHGLQTGHPIILVQWQNVNGNLKKEVIWPKTGATAPVSWKK